MPDAVFKGLPRGLIEALRDGDLVPFAGAGVSAAVRTRGGEAAFPTWRGLLLGAAERLEQEGKPKKATLVRALLEDDPPQYLPAANTAREALEASWFDFLRAQLDPPRNAIDGESLALAGALWRLQSKLLVTTNYDRVLAWSCPPALVGDLRVWTVGSESELAEIVGKRVRKPTLWHLHGHIDRVNEIILTPGGYERLYPTSGSVNPEHLTNYEAALSTLRTLLTGSTLLFVGFSLADEAFRNQVRWVREVFRRGGRQHYVLAQTDEAAGIARELDGLDVQIVRFASFGAPLVALLEALIAEAEPERTASPSAAAPGRDAPSERDKEPDDALMARGGVQPPGPRKTDALLDRVEAICRVVHGADRVERLSGPEALGDYLRVVRASGAVHAVAPVASVQAVTGDVLTSFGTLLGTYRVNDITARGTLVYGGEPPAPEVEQRARGLGIDLRSFVEFQGLIDFRQYVAKQTRELRENRTYPPDLFVPQRISFEIGRDSREHDDALEAILTLLREPTLNFVLVLGDFGSGKSFLSRRVALRLVEDHSPLVPIRIDMRQLEKAHSLTALVSQHMALSDVSGFDSEKFRYMLGEGRLALLFDGFDELALRVSYEQASKHLETVCEAALGSAKVMVTSRTQHFASDEEVRTVLRRQIEAVNGHRIAKLLPFDRARVRAYLAHVLKDEQAADRRLALLEGVKDLSALCSNPRMLSFIVEIDEAELEEARHRGEQITAAGLYRRLLDRWVDGEFERANPPGAGPGLSKDQLRAFLERLALKLWLEGRDAIPLADLLTSSRPGLEQAAPSADDLGPVLHQAVSGSLLVRDAHGNFSFLHFSLVEWLVANAMANGLRRGEEQTFLDSRDASDLMVDFLADLSGGELAARWARATLARIAAETASRNALRVLKTMGLDAAQPVKLASKDLSGQDLRNSTLGKSSLEGATLNGTILVGADLSGANLTGARGRGPDFSRAVLTRSDLTNTELVFPRFVDAEMRACSWNEGTRLVGANLLGARLDSNFAQQAARHGSVVPTAESVEPSWVTGAEWRSVAVASNGLLLAAGSQASEIVLHDLSTLRAIRRLGAPGAVRSLAFSRDGALLASASSEAVTLWNAMAARTVRVLPVRGGILQVAFSHDDTHLAGAGSDGTVRVWEVATGRELDPLKGHRDWVRGVAFSPDRRTLASVSDDSTVRLWDYLSSQPLGVLEGHEGWVRSVAFSPDGRWLATGGANGMLRVWDPAARRLDHTVEGHGSNVAVTRVAFRPDSRWLVSADLFHVRISDLATRSEVHAMNLGTTALRDLTFTPDGRFLVLAGAELAVVDVSSAQEGRTVASPRSSTPLSGVDFSYSGRLVATTSRDFVRVAESAFPHQQTDIAFPESRRITSNLAWTPDERTLAFGVFHDVHVVDLVQERAPRQLRGHRDWVRALACSPDNRWLASGSDDTTVRLWDLASGQTVRDVKAHGGWVFAIAFSPDGSTIASGSSEGPIRLWDAATLREKRAIETAPRVVEALAFSPDGMVLAAAGSGRRQIDLWSMNDERALASLAAHTDDVVRLTFSPNGRQLASASKDRSVVLWDISSAKVVHRLDGHRGTVHGVSFSPDGQGLATASEDGSVRFWNVETGECLGEQVHFQNGWVTLAGNEFRAGGELHGEFWYATALSRFEPDEVTKFLDVELPENWAPFHVGQRAPLPRFPARPPAATSWWRRLWGS